MRAAESGEEPTYFATTCAMMKLPIALTSKVLLNSSAVYSMQCLVNTIPAKCARISILPNSREITVATEFTAASSLMSSFYIRCNRLVLRTPLAGFVGLEDRPRRRCL